MTSNAGDQMKSIAPFKIIYLDQNAWSNLSKSYRKGTGELSQVAYKLIEAADNAKAIFPLSISRFTETIKWGKGDRRRELLDFMDKLSRNRTVLPFTVIRDLEILDNSLRVQKRETIGDLAPLVQRTGISHMMGLGYPRIEKITGIDEETQRKLNDLLRKAVEDRRALYKISQNGLKDEYREKWEETIKPFLEDMRFRRETLSKIPKEQGYKTELAFHFTGTIIQKLVSSLLNDGVSPSILQPFVIGKKPLLTFFRSFPACYCNFELNYFRDSLNLKVDANDVQDILALSGAIPYSDIVVTEDQWKEAANQRKLSTLFRTKVLSENELVDLQKLI